MKYEYWLGLKYLRSKNKHTFLSVISWISILGVAVGVMALIIVLSAMSGFQADFRARILGNNAPLIVFSANRDMAQNEKNLSDIKSVPGVKGASPFVYGEVLLVSDTGKSSGAVVYGIEPEKARAVISLENDLTSGSLEELNTTKSGLPGIILGQAIANEQLYVSVGSTVSVVSPKGEISPFGYAPKMRKFEVVGLFKTGLYEYDSKSAYTYLGSAQNFFEEEGRIKGIQVSVDKLSMAEKVGMEIQKKLGSGFFVRHWMELNKDLFNAFKLEKTVFFIIVVMIVLVASFNIVSTLTLLVLTKTKEISILQAMGAHSVSISRIFIFVGSSIGFIGTLIGIALGLLGSVLLKNYIPFPLDANIYQVDHLPIKIDAMEVLLVGVCAVLISFISTIYPALQAARVEPSKGIRNE